MATEHIAEVIAQQTWLDPLGNVLQQGVTGAFAASGETGQHVKNALSGKWLGHPLHPALTDILVGSWTASLLFDLIETVSGRDTWRAAADTTLGVGLVTALAAGISGPNDWQYTVDKPRRIGLVHELLNLSAVGFNATSFALRRTGAREWARRVAYVAYITVLASTWDGGDLVFEQEIG
jgi:uncharacterized membrane protein